MSSEGPPILDTKISSERLFTLTTGAETCESAAIGCLAVNTSTAADALSSAVIATVDCVSTAMRDVKAKAKVLCALRNKRLEWQLEEFAARQAGLEGFVRQLCVYSDASDLDAIEDSVKTAGQLLDEMDSLTAHSAALFACGSAIAVFAVSGMSHVQQCIDVVQSAVSHPEWLRRGEGHRVTIVCCDSHGDAVKRVSAKDVYVDFSDVTGWIVGDITAEDGTVSVSVTPSTESAQTVTAFITIDSAHFTIPLKICEGGNRGIVVNGNVIAVSNVSSHKVCVYSLSTGALESEFGGSGRQPGQLTLPQKLCLSPLTGNLFVADFGNTRVQEFTLAGSFVRAIDVGEGDVYGLAASTTLLAVSVQGVSIRLLMYDMTSGALVRSFGAKGTAVGQLFGNDGIRFTPDGDHILISESTRLSLFTITGDFVRCIGKDMLKSAYDVDFAPSGDIIVAEWGKHSICVFSPDGSTLLRSFGAKGEGPGQFQAPTALAMHDGKLYVLEYAYGRVQVFT